MYKFIKKNKFYIAAIVLFIILYYYGNNMEFYDNVNKQCNSDKPEKISEAKGPYLDPSDDVVLERRDMKQLRREQLDRFNYDGLDNWNVISDVNKGWWGDHIKAGGLYPAPKNMVWAD